MIIRVIDTETTGFPTEEEKHALVEVASCDVSIGSTGEIEVYDPRSMLVNPGRPIPPEASAVHHITDADVAEAPPPDAGCAFLMEGAVDIFASFNMDFDKEFFGGGGKPMLCIWKAALRVWKEAPAHSNQALRYWLGLDSDMEWLLTMPPHRAGPDAYVSAHLLKRLIESGTSVDDMLRWSKGAALLTSVTFGKHKGERWDDLPADYLRWILDKSDLDRDTKANARHRLKQRGLL